MPTAGSRLGSVTVGGRVLWRQIRAAPGAAVTILAATLLTAVFVTAAPRLLDRVSSDDLRESMAEAEPEQRNIRAESVERIGAGVAGDPFSNLQRRGEALLDEGFPQSVRSVVTETRHVVETPQFRVSSFPEDLPGPFPTFFVFRYQQGIEDHLTVVEGTLPAARQPIPMLFGPDCPPDRLAVDEFEGTPETACFADEIPVFETAITAETAEAMMLEPGDQVFLRPDSEDRLWFLGAQEEERTFVLAISGIVELSDLGEEYWFADTGLHRPRIMENPDFRLIFATGLMAPDRYDQMLTDLPAAGFRYTWRFFVDEDLVDASAATELRADIGRILPPNDESVLTFLDDLITEYLGQRALTLSLMSTAVSGLLAAAVGVVLVLATLIAERQAGSTVLIRDRGGSRGQLTLTSVYTGLLLVAPAAILGYLATLLAFPGTDSLAPARGSAALAFGGSAAVVAAGSPYILRRLGALQRLDRPGAGSAGRRVVLEVFVLIAGAGSLALLRRRGLADPSDATGDFDVLLAVAPAVLGLAAGLVVLRLMTPLMRVLSWLGSRGRAMVAFVGFRRLVDQPPAGRAPPVVILLAVAVAVFSSVVRDAVADGQERHSWQVVGGDHRIDGGRDPGTPVPAAVEVEGLPGVLVWAEAAEFPATRTIGLPRPPRVSVLAVDPIAYQEVLSGSGSEVPELERLITADADSGPLPALVSSRWNAAGPPAVGSEFALQIGSVGPEVVVAGVVERFPYLPHQQPFVIVAIDDMRRAWGDLPVRATVIYLRSAEGEADQLAVDLAEMGGTTRLAARSEVIADLAGDPFALWVDRGLTAVFYLALVFAMVAALSLLTVTAGRRRRDLGFLRILGLSSGQATAITALEQVPPVLVATVAGAATGGAVAQLLAPALDIESFTGRLLPAEIAVDPLAIATITAAMLVILGIAVVSFVAATRHDDYGRLLRVGDE